MPGLTINDLADEVGIPARTIRFYIAEGLLSGPGGRGKAALYDGDHLLRLRMIRRLVDQHVRIEDIRELLRPLSTDEIRVLLVEEGARAARLEESQTPRSYVADLLQNARFARNARTESPLSPPLGDAMMASSSHHPQWRRWPEPRPTDWHRWELAPGVELLVRVDALDRYRDLLHRLLRNAAELAE